MVTVRLVALSCAPSGAASSKITVVSESRWLERMVASGGSEMAAVVPIVFGACRVRMAAPRTAHGNCHDEKHEADRLNCIEEGARQRIDQPDRVLAECKCDIIGDHIFDEAHAAPDV